MTKNKPKASSKIVIGKASRDFNSIQRRMIERERELTKSEKPFEFKQLNTNSQAFKHLKDMGRGYITLNSPKGNGPTYDMDTETDINTPMIDIIEIES